MTEFTKQTPKDCKRTSAGDWIKSLEAPGSSPLSDHYLNIETLSTEIPRNKIIGLDRNDKRKSLCKDKI